jgi:N-acetylmuramoyl-L-alanine amidase
MTFLSQPLGFTPAEFQTYVEKLRWHCWRPQFIALHNTAEPNLAQWVHSGLGKVAGLQRVKNLNHYYQSAEGWHSGPHLFIAPDLIWVACDLTANGVHATCYNAVSIGVEMVGDYASEAFDSGDGAKVRDNAVAAVAVLHKALRLTPETMHFHKECLRDHHDCPGKNVVKADVIARVKEAMKGAAA